MGSAAKFSGPAVTPDLAYAEIMFIRSLADRNRAPRVVKLVTVGAITVTAQVHDSRKRCDQHAKEWGLLIGNHRGLSHGQGHNHSRYAVRQANYDLASCGANGSSTNPAEPAVTTSRPWLRVLWPAAAYSRRKRLGLVPRSACSWRCDKSGSARSGFDSLNLHKINCQ